MGGWRGGLERRRKEKALYCGFRRGSWVIALSIPTYLRNNRRLGGSCNRSATEMETGAAVKWVLDSCKQAPTACPASNFEIEYVGDEQAILLSEIGII